MSLGKSLDSSLDRSEEIRFKQKNKTLMEHFAKILHFSYEEIENLCIIYYKLQKNGEGKMFPIRRTQVKDVLHNGMDMTEYRLMPYIFSTIDRSISPYMSLENWLKMLSLYMRGTLEEKIEYCYSVYLNVGISDKFIRNNLIQLLKHSLIKDNNEDDEEGVKDMVDMIIKRMDYDRDGKISFADYRETVINAPLFLETFGPVLPSRLAVYAFKTTFTPNTGKM